MLKDSVKTGAFFQDSCTPSKIPATSHSLRITLRVELKLLLYESPAGVQNPDITHARLLPVLRNLCKGLPAASNHPKERSWTSCLYDTQPCRTKEQTWTSCLYQNQFVRETAQFQANPGARRSAGGRRIRVEEGRLYLSKHCTSKRRGPGN